MRRRRGSQCDEANRWPMIGGMVSSTVLTLVVIPAVYALWRERQIVRARGRRHRRLTLPESVEALLEETAAQPA